MSQDRESTHEESLVSNMAESLQITEQASPVLNKSPNKLRQGFISLAETLLESVSDVFPECTKSESVLRIFRAFVKGNECLENTFIRRCHVLFRQHAQGIKDKDEEQLFVIVEGLDHLRDINLREKWEDPDFTEESKNHLWQYIAALKTYSDLFTAVPAEVMGKIESVAGSIGEQITRGELDLKNMDLGSIGQNLLGNLTAEELAGFEGNLPEIYESLSEVAGVLGGANGAGVDVAAIMEQLTQKTGEQKTGNMDMSQILQQLSSHLPPSAGGGGGHPDMTQMLQAVAPMLQAVQSATSRGDSVVETPRVKHRVRRRAQKD